MKFIVKKTTELTDNECMEILYLFNDIFHECRTLTEFQNQYKHNVLGFAYHSLIIDEGKIVGSNAFVPGYYLVDKEKHLFVVSIDTMIHKSHRGIENFYDLIYTAYKRMSDDGVTFVMGFPNDNSYPVYTATNLMPEIGRMDTYCLPVHIGGVKKSFSFLNPFTAIFCRCWLWVSSIFASDKVHTFRVHKENESYNKTRYKRMDGDYTKVNLPDLEFFYKVKMIEGIRTATLIDVTQKSSKNFCKAVRYIVNSEKRNFDLLLYVGRLPFRFAGMIKVPHKFEPKKFYFNGKWIVSNAKDLKTVCNIDDWDLNLSDFDII
jgi:hypothetical protein